MCGRYTFTQTSIPEEIAPIEGPDIALSPRYNIAPSQFCPIIPQDDPKRVHFYYWGLVPTWAKDQKIGYRMINARAETIAEKPAFRIPFKQSRCLVLADGFYEWKKTAGGKQPYRILLKNEEVFYLAGLTSQWKTQKGEWLSTFTIITTEPNEFMEGLHDRMPAILPSSEQDAWMDPQSDPQELLALLRPYPSEEMKAYPVSPSVGNVKNDHPQLILPYQAPPTLF